VAEVEFNPYASTCKQLEEKIVETRERFDGLGEALARHAHFDETKANSEIVELKQKVLNLSTVLTDLDRRIDREREAATALAERGRVRLDPRTWFSAERFRAKDRHGQALESLHDLEAQRQACADEQASLVEERQETLDKRSTYRKTDASMLQAEREQLHGAVKELKERLLQVQPLRDKVERAIAELRSKYEELSQRRDQLIHDIDRAQAFDRELDNAADSRERAMIHEECGRLFNHGSPRRVLSLVRHLHDARVLFGCKCGGEYTATRITPSSSSAGSSSAISSSRHETSRFIAAARLPSALAFATSARCIASDTSE
jgi:chromosome segregation ATPase